MCQKTDLVWPAFPENISGPRVVKIDYWSLYPLMQLPIDRLCRCKNTQHTSGIRGMNDIVFNIDTMSFEFKLEFFVRFADVFFEAAVVPQNRHKFAVLILWALASAIHLNT